MTIKEQLEAIWRELGLHDAHNPARWVVINRIVDYFAIIDYFTIVDYCA